MFISADGRFTTRCCLSCVREAVVRDFGERRHNRSFSDGLSGVLWLDSPLLGDVGL